MTRKEIVKLSVKLHLTTATAERYICFVVICYQLLIERFEMPVYYYYFSAQGISDTEGISDIIIIIGNENNIR